MASLARFAATRITAGAVGLLQVLLFARWMPVGEFAAYSVLLAAMGVSMIVGSLGVDRVLYRQIPLAHMARERGQVSRLAAFARTSRMTVATPVAAAIILASWSGDMVFGRVEAALWVAAMTLTQVQCDVSAATANALLRFEAQARIAVSMLLVRLAAAGAVQFSTGSLDAATLLAITVGGNLLQSALNYGLATRRALADVDGAPAAAPPYEAPSFRSLAAASWTNYVSYLFGLPWQGAAATLIVAATSDPASTALFALLMNLVERARPYLPMQLLQSAVEPTLIRRYAVDGNRLLVARQVELLRRANFGLLWLVAMLSFACGDAAVAALTGGKYVGGGFLAGLMFAALALRGVSGGLFISANVLGEMRALMRVYGLVTLLSLPLLAWAALRHGGVGVVAVSVLPSVMLWAGLRLRGHDCAIGVWRPDKDLLFMACGALALAVGLFVTHRLGAPWSLPVGAVAASVAYLASTAAARVFRRDELALLRHGLKGRAA